MRRIGLFGGSFDPVHAGHAALAEAARKSLPLDEVWWVPAGRAWQKARALAPAQDRLAMLRLALASMPAGTHRIEPCELERPGNSYTIDTVLELSRHHPDVQWVLLIGWDQFRGLPTWHRWEDLLQRVTLAVARRPGFEAPLPDEIKGIAFKSVPMPEMPVSSTEIRQRLAEGLAIEGMVDPAVAGYIESKQLYRAG